MTVRAGFLFCIWMFAVSSGVVAEDKEQAAKQAALAWLELVDSG